MAELEELDKQNAAMRNDLLRSSKFPLEAIESGIPEPEELEAAFQDLRSSSSPFPIADIAPATEAQATCHLVLQELDSFAPVLRTLAVGTNTGSLEHTALQTIGHIAQLLQLATSSQEYRSASATSSPQLPSAVGSLSQPFPQIGAPARSALSSPAVNAISSHEAPSQAKAT